MKEFNLADIIAGIFILCLLVALQGCQTYGALEAPLVGQDAAETTQLTTLQAPLPEWDSSTQAAFGELQQKLAAIKEYSFVAHVAEDTPQTQTAYTIQRSFRRPNLLYFKRTITAHDIPHFIDHTSTAVSDGREYWIFQQMAPGSGQKMMQFAEASADGQLTDEQQQEIQAAADNFEMPQVSCVDLEQCAEAGFGAEAVLATAGESLIQPFEVFDLKMETLKLEHDDERFWTFNALSPGPRAMQMRLIFHKGNGALSKIETHDGQGETKRIWLFSEVKINSGLDDSLFIFTPPSDDKVADATAILIESLLNPKPVLLIGIGGQ